MLECNISEINLLPEIYARYPLIEIGWVNLTDTTLWEEYTNEWWIVSSRPFFNRKCERICVMFWWIGELQIAMHGQLNLQKNRSLFCSSRELVIIDSLSCNWIWIRKTATGSWNFCALVDSMRECLSDSRHCCHCHLGRRTSKGNVSGFRLVVLEL